MHVQSRTARCLQSILPNSNPYVFALKSDGDRRILSNARPYPRPTLLSTRLLSVLTANPQAPTHFAAVFRGGESAYLQVVQLKDFDYTQGILSLAFLDSLKGAASEVHSVYDVPA